MKRPCFLLGEDKLPTDIKNMSKDEKKEQQSISAPAPHKSWGELLLENWMKPVEDFRPGSQPQGSNKDQSQRS